MRIGFLDSGIGGITTLAQSVKALGGGDYVYLADTKNAPFGNKSFEELCNVGKSGISFLKRLGCEYVVLACNTLTANAKADLVKLFPEITFIGTEPAVLPATRECLKVALLATPSTIKSQRMQELLGKCRGQVTCYPLASLAGIIENSIFDLPLLHKYVENNLIQLLSYDAVVLGCTHFVYLKEMIASHFPKIKIYDGNVGVATRLKALVGEQKTPLRCQFFDSKGKKSEKCEKIFSDFLKKILKGY